MSKSILVVEDQEDNRQIIRDMLTFTDYEIMEAESGEQALEAVAKQRPDLIGQLMWYRENFASATCGEEQKAQEAG